LAVENGVSQRGYPAQPAYGKKLVEEGELIQLSGQVVHDDVHVSPGLNERFDHINPAGGRSRHKRCRIVGFFSVVEVRPGSDHATNIFHGPFERCAKDVVGPLLASPLRHLTPRKTDQLDRPIGQSLLALRNQNRWTTNLNWQLAPQNG
jgi:hypothetical protein